MTNVWVQGVPATKGSTRSFINPKTGRIVTKASCKHLPSWNARIRDEVLKVHQWGLLTTGSVVLELDFSFVRPKSVPVRKRPRHTAKPDLDKLIRAALDALTGIIYQDDSQVVSISATKCYCDSPVSAGLMIGIDWS
jgi:crossover junction endodeoxyribonuclease RusA